MATVEIVTTLAVAGEQLLAEPCEDEGDAGAMALLQVFLYISGHAKEQLLDHAAGADTAVKDAMRLFLSTGDGWHLDQLRSQPASQRLIDAYVRLYDAENELRNALWA